MSEIEKMYENAGIKLDCCKYAKYGYEGEEGTWYYCKKEDRECWTYLTAGNADCVEKEYPPFTAEKQIAILMFILNKFGDIGFQKMYSIRGNDESTRKDFIKCLCDCEHETWDSRPVDFYYQKGASGDNFEESLAGLINNLWQDLTELEQEQIRSILRG